jgi:hypothetical protein
MDESTTVQLPRTLATGVPVLLPCPSCRRLTEPIEAPGTVVHYSQIRCGTCHNYLKWRPWPRHPDGSRRPRPAHLEPHNFIAEICP